MNKNKHIFINYRLFLLLTGFLLGILFIISTLQFGDKYSNEIAIIVIVILSIFFILGILFNPHCCIITSDEVKIIYAFGLKESAEWRDIRKIWCSTMPGIFFSFADAYNFVGIKGKKAFFMDGTFYKSKRMTQLLEQYAKNKLEK